MSYPIEFIRLRDHDEAEKHPGVIGITRSRGIRASRHANLSALPLTQTQTQPVL